MSEHKTSTWQLVLMMLWFGALTLGSAAMALLGLAFSNEPGGRGNPSIIDYAIIFGRLVLSVLLGAICLIAWQKAHRLVSYVACVLSVLIIASFSILFGI